MRKSLMDDLVRLRDRVAAQLAALNNVIETFREGPHGEATAPLSEEHKQHISAGIRRANRRKNRQRTRLSWDERREQVLNVLRGGPASLPDVRKVTGFFETLTRNTLERLVEEGTVIKGTERVGPGGSYLYALKGQQNRVVRQAQTVLS